MGLLAGLGGLAGGIIGGRSDKKRGEEVTKTREAAWQQLMNEFARYGININQLLGGGKENLEKALKEIERLGGERERGIRSSGIQQQANISQSMGRRGLGNTTLLQNMARGQNYQTGRQLTDLSESVSRGRAGAYGNLANYAMGSAGMLGNVFGQRMGLAGMDPFLNKGMPGSTAGASGRAGSRLLGGLGGAFGKGSSNFWDQILG